MSFNDEVEQSVHVSHAEGDEAPSSRGSKKWIGAAAAVAVVATIAVGGMALIKVMGGGGAQPEDVLPANAIAFVKLDLNPSAGQKLAAYRLASKFPTVKDKITSEETSIKESTFGAILMSDTGLGLNYAKDIEPWLGDRMGVGVFPDLDADKVPEIGLAIAVTDQKAATLALDKAIANVTSTSDKVGYAFADDFVIVSDTTAHATALAQAGKVRPLALPVWSTYGDDVKSLGSDQIGVAWVDITAASKAIPTDILEGGGLTLLNGADDAKKASGRFVVGLHAESSFLELNGKGIEIKGAEPLLEADAGTEGAMITSFPADVFGAASVKGLGKAVGAFYTSFTAGDDQLGVKSMLSSVGINSAKEVETLLGAETGVVVGGTKDTPEFAVRTRGSDADAALAIARRALGDGSPAGGIGLTVRRITGPDGIVVGMGPNLTSAIFNKSGSTLGDSEAFRQVMPDAAKADGAEFVNVAKILPLLGSDVESGADLDWLKPLNAVGLTATGDPENAFRLRISVK